MSPRSPARLEVSWKNGDELLSAFDLTAGRVIAPAPGGVLPAQPVVGELVEFRARLQDRALEVIAHCRVIERLAANPAGWRLEFAAGQEGRRELLLALARGDQVPWGKRRSKRVPVMLSATVHREGRRTRAHTINVSDEGLCLVTKSPYAVNADISMRVWPLPFAFVWPPLLRGRVTSCFQLEEEYAIGINLRFVSAGQARGWKRVVAKALQRASRRTQ
ncbi:MAG: PilZ domain-containing protein [Myxococcota bacterium]